MFGEINDGDRAPTCSELRRSGRQGEADLICVFNARYGEPTPLSGERKLQLDRACQSLALVGTAAIDACAGEGATATDAGPV